MHSWKQIISLAFKEQTKVLARTSSTLLKGNKTITSVPRAFQLFAARNLSSSVMSSNYWDYSKQHGPTEWHKHWNEGKRQSPIDILLKDAQYDEKLASSSLIFDNSGIKFALKNLGVNVAARPGTFEDPLILSGGPLDHRYQFHEVHFHWGRNPDMKGCEHTIDGHRFSAEMHLVHWNSELYNSAAEAVPSSLGLSVLGVFLDEGQYEANPYLEKLLDLFLQVKYKDQTHQSNLKFDPYSMLPSSTNEYFTYGGSLTTPPLCESVTWIVFREPMKVSHSQMEKFRQLLSVVEEDEHKEHPNDPFNFASGISCCGCPTIGDNYRPVMPLNGRKVLSSFQI